MSQTRATAAVVDFIASASFADIPSDALTIGRRCIADGVAVMLAGSTTAASDILRAQVREDGSRAEATIVGHDSFRTRAASAALVNATSGHAHDYDDTQLSTAADRIFGLLTHPTIPPLAASLALGERLGVSGRTMLEAFLIGFEVECKIADAILPTHYKQGFHTSGTIGAFGAMAASAKLLKLDRAALAHAIGITASMSAGIRVSFGTMTKPLHVGRAAFNGVTAAELASKGFTSGADALDGQWGFFQVNGGGFDAERIVGALGNPWTIVSPGVSIKPYPCGCLGHPAMDAMLTLVTQHDVKPEQIRRIRLRAGSNILNPLRYKMANTELEAKFCPPFMLSAVALRRKAGVNEFSDDFVRSGPVQAMMRKVETVFDQEIENQGFVRMLSIVEVELEDGRVLSQPSGPYRGGPERPFTREELRDKFDECGSLVLPQDRLDDIFARIERIDQVGNVRDFTALLTERALTTA
ncbi:MAG TPA: MmgE/PrpD family protein [Vicinamibacterales bacterium]|nr:MmgE/PrpD family protein [Vicinamibacterales bacterium]